LAQLYGTLGGEVVMAGKPFSPVYRVGLETAARELGRNLDPTRILCIGDGIGTDVKGANGAGLDCLFIAAGVHGADAITAGGGLDAQKANALLEAEGAHARYAMPRLVW
jgi:ribonucleotide monophosphatase NagD (HAD superfamily)